MKVTIKLKQGRCMTIKIMRVTDYSHSRVRPLTIAHQRDLTRTMSPQETG